MSRVHVSVSLLSPLTSPLSDALTSAEEAIGVPIHGPFLCGSQRSMGHRPAERT
jgi:hypothetical protein